MSHPVRTLVTNERSQLAVIVIGLPVSSAPYGVQIAAVIALALVAAVASSGARSAWRGLPTRSQ